jgi:CRISPR-associated endonuclease/helicase Cas3
MLGAITTFWGKLAETPGQPREWHPLLHHCADVAACAEALLDRTVLNDRLARLAGLRTLDEVQVARLAVLAALHDIGKFNHGFQAKCGDLPVLTKRGHVREVLALFTDDRFAAYQGRLVDALPTPELEAWASSPYTAFELLVAAICHHGRPYACEPPPNFNEHIWKPHPLGDPFVGIADLVAAARRWFPRAFEPGGAPFTPDPDFQHGYAGLVMLADWLGSHRDFFPFSDDINADRMTFARARARLALRETGLDASLARGLLGPNRPTFASISPYPTMQPAQEATGELSLATGGSLTILEAETGSGKTEAALLRYAQLFHAGSVDGLYFALPTRTAATQIHTRVHEAVRRAFPGDDAPPVLLAVPGYLKVDDHEGKRLPEFRVLWNDDEKERMRYRGWAAENTKRYLAGAVVIGTIDQVLLSTLMTSHAHLRATALTRQLLVVDEVHASDAYMNRLLEEVLAFHLRAGGHAFLMSATLGADARTRLLNAVGAASSPSPYHDATVAPYPLLTHLEPGAAAVAIAVPHRGRTRTITPRLLPIAADPAAIAAEALAAAREGARVLVVRNLVGECVAAQEALEAAAERAGEGHLLFRVGDVVAPHHSRFARADRRLLDAAVEASFGKGRPEGHGCVLVATQTVEQSLDLDADLLLTDLCPMDVLLQRIGRLHRHERPPEARPLAYRAPIVGVLVPRERDLGTFILPQSGKPLGPHGYGTVYEDLRVLEATWRACASNPAFQIPADNRRLVEAATHPEALASITSELGDRWEKHKTHLRGGQATDRGCAERVLINRALPFGEARFLDKEEVGKVTSRLGDDDRAITFTKPVPGPFSEPVQALVLPHHMLRGAPDDPLAPIAATAHPGGLTFRYGDAFYRYDRLGLRRQTQR